MSTNKFETNALHAGHDVTKHAGTRAGLFAKLHRMSLIIQNTANLFGLSEAGYIYTRLNNPTIILEQRLAALEAELQL
jgi:O-acetylhomoserine (thiol)-lyase